MKQKWPELESMAMLNVSDLKRLIHDLKTHQIELQLQNEELRDMQAKTAGNSLIKCLWPLRW
jgi:hypothetical protein